MLCPVLPGGVCVHTAGRWEGVFSLCYLAASNPGLCPAVHPQLVTRICPPVKGHRDKHRHSSHCRHHTSETPNFWMCWSLSPFHSALSPPDHGSFSDPEYGMAGSSHAGCCIQLHLPPLPHSPQTNKEQPIWSSPHLWYNRTSSLKWMYPDTLSTIFFFLNLLFSTC